MLVGANPPQKETPIVGAEPLRSPSAGRRKTCRYQTI